MAQRQDITIRTGQPVTVADCEFVSEGFQFVGWNTERNGSGVEYLPGEVVSFNKSTVLYAQWKKKLDVTFDDNTHLVQFDEPNILPITFDDLVDTISFEDCNGENT